MRWARRIPLIALLVALPVGVHLFVSRNAEQIAIDYLGGRFEGVQIWLALLAAFGSGAVVAPLLAMLRGARLRLEVRRYRRAARELEAEVHQLRNLPLADEPHPQLAEEGGVETADTGELLAPAAGLERGS